MIKPKRLITEELDEAITTVKAMAAGELPVTEKRLRTVWIVDHAATDMLEGPRSNALRQADHPIRQRFHRLDEALNVNPKVKRAFLATWARHITKGGPEPDRAHSLIMSSLDGLMAKDETLGITELIRGCLGIPKKNP
ncbi:MAG: hypothetical protein ACLQU5_27050 [Isosphaeraceae bacterium]